MSHYKNILHRALLTRTRVQSPLGSRKCRLCKAPKEHIHHLAHCPVLAPLWSKFLSLAQVHPVSPTDREMTLLLGIRATGSALTQAASDFLLILWKFIIISFTLVDIENRKFSESDVWRGALRRYISKVNSLSYKAAGKRVRAEARATTIDLRTENSYIHPFAKLNDQGDIEWSSHFISFAYDVLRETHEE